MKDFNLSDALERAGRTAVQAYFSAWLVTGGDFDGLYAADTLKYTVVAVAASIAMALGLKKVGDKNAASVLKPKS